jgi:hypothetical protein
MTGLLKNHYYSALGSAKILFLFFLVIGFALLITGNSALLNGFALVSATAFTFNAVSGFRKEASTQWNKYELTVPVRRKDIVMSRYVTHSIWFCIGILIAVVFVVSTVLIHGNQYFYYEARDPLSLFSMGTGSALFMGTFFYPLIYLFGVDKNEILIVISLLGAVGTTLAIIWLINTGFGDNAVSDTVFFISILIFMAASIIAFIASFFITVCIYQKKEY